MRHQPSVTVRSLERLVMALELIKVEDDVRRGAAAYILGQK
jgi:hypothetical protein